MDAAAGPAPAGSWSREISDLARAATGGLLFGVPLLYTMEVWWSGARTSPARNLAVLAIAVVLVTVLQRTAGFRQTRDATWGDAILDAVEAVALSIVVVFGVLVLLREITPDTPAPVAMGKIVHQTLGFAIGASVARQYLTERRDDVGDESEDADGQGDGGDDGDAPPGLNPTVADLGATVVGSVFVALNVAPTDEVAMLVSALDAVWLIALLAASLVISYAVVFVAGFSGQRERRSQPGLFQHPITETVFCYLVALVCAVAMLELYHRREGPWQVTLAQTVVLGLPASVGGAAGRLAI